MSESISGFSEIMTGLTLIAILTGPIVAVRIEKYLEKRKEGENRQIHLFKTLMATRVDRVSFEHVRALNSIDVEFDKTEEIIKSWKTYLAHLGTCPNQGKDEEGQLFSARMKLWIDKGDDLFVDLLMSIAQTLGYKFDINHLKREFYTPKAHGDLLTDQYRFRRAILDLLEGKQSLGVHNVILPSNKEQHDTLIAAYTKLLNGEQPLLVSMK